MKQTFKTICLSSSILFFAGCVGNTAINLTEFPQKINKKITVPQVCKSEFQALLPKVAVVDFVNNSTFGKAQTKDTNKDASISIGISPFFAGAAVKNSKSSTSQLIDPKLSSSIVPLIEDVINQNGGASMFSRVDMGKIDAELKLQDSGLLDPNSVVEFGQASGVQYIVTGSLNYVKQNIRNNSAASGAVNQATQYSKDDNVKLAGALFKLFTAVTDGTTVDTSLTVKIIDVSTGKIKFTHTIEESSTLRTNTTPTYSQVVGAIKESLKKSMPYIEKEFSRYFTTQGYIKQLRTNGENIVTQISLGQKDRVKTGEIFNVYSFEKNIDPLTNEISCDKIKQPLELIVTTEVSNDASWLNISKGESSRLRVLQIVQKKPKE